jgi:hypothetical protein
MTKVRAQVKHIFAEDGARDETWINLDDLIAQLGEQLVADKKERPLRIKLSQTLIALRDTILKSEDSK